MLIILRAGPFGIHKIRSCPRTSSAIVQQVVYLLSSICPYNCSLSWGWVVLCLYQNNQSRANTALNPPTSHSSGSGKGVPVGAGLGIKLLAKFCGEPSPWKTPLALHCREPLSPFLYLVFLYCFLMPLRSGIFVAILCLAREERHARWENRIFELLPKSIFYWEPMEPADPRVGKEMRSKNQCSAAISNNPGKNSQTVPVIKEPEMTLSWPSPQLVTKSTCVIHSKDHFKFVHFVFLLNDAVWII